jgi:hypothetical protein
MDLCCRVYIDGQDAGNNEIQQRATLIGLPTIFEPRRRPQSLIFLMDALQTDVPFSAWPKPLIFTNCKYLVGCKIEHSQHPFAAFACQPCVAASGLRTGDRKLASRTLSDAKKHTHTSGDSANWCSSVSFSLMLLGRHHLICMTESFRFLNFRKK